MKRFLLFFILFLHLFNCLSYSQCKIDTVKYLQTLESIKKDKNKWFYADTVLINYTSCISNCNDRKIFFSLSYKTSMFFSDIEKKPWAYKILISLIQRNEKYQDTLLLCEAVSKLLDFYFRNGLKNEFSSESVKADSVASLIRQSEIKLGYYYSWGWMAYNMGLSEVSRKLFHKAYIHLMDDIRKTKRKINSFDSEILGWVGNSFIPLGIYDSAIHYRKKAMQWAKDLNDTFMVADCQRYIAQTFQLKKEYDSCLHYALPSFEYYKNKVRIRAIWLLNPILTSAVKCNKPDIFSKYALTVEDTLFYKTDFPYFKQQRYLLLAKINKFRKNYENALRYFERFTNFRDSMKILEEEKSIKNEIAQFNLQKEIEKIKIEELEKNKELEGKLAREKQANVFYLVFVLGLMVFLGITYKNLRQKKKILNIVSQQHFMLEEKNKEIGDSIQYAHRLQKALMAEPDTIKNELNKSRMDIGILYLPKDVVAGDFYFYYSNAKNVFLAVGDCTGHGVPGAMVSVLCMNALLQCIRDYGLMNPGDILQKSRELIVDAFSKSEQNIYDGMDCSLLCLGKTEPDKIFWAGANIPLWILRNRKLLMYKPDKMPVGKSILNQNFTTHEIFLEKHDHLLISTDGFADQFGGDKGKKMKSSNLIKWIEENIQPSDTPVLINEKLHNLHLDWKRSQEQTDDICIMSLKFNF